LAAGATPVGKKADTDGTVSVWDVADPTNPHRLGIPLTGNAGRVTSLAFAPDGATLVAGSAGRTGRQGVVRFWDVTDLIHLRRHLVPTACDQAGGLSREDWERYVPEVPFAAPCGGS
jgi:WD40 repeat protein